MGQSLAQYFEDTPVGEDPAHQCTCGGAARPCGCRKAVRKHKAWRHASGDPPAYPRDTVIMESHRRDLAICTVTPPEGKPGRDLLMLGRTNSCNCEATSPLTCWR
eukprot:gene2190-30220_t